MTVTYKEIEEAELDIVNKLIDKYTNMDLEIKERYNQDLAKYNSYDKDTLVKIIVLDRLYNYCYVKNIKGDKITDEKLK